MKNSFYILVAISLLGSITILNGQEFELGIEGNFGLSQFTDTEDHSDFYNNNTYGIKLFVEKKATERIDASIGIVYRSLSDQDINDRLVFGCDISVLLGGGGHQTRTISAIRANYIGIPLSLKFRLTNQPSFLYAKLGTEFLVYLSSKVDSKINECGTNEIPHKFSSDGSYSSLLFMPNVGLGLDFSAKQLNYYVELTAGASVNKVFDKYDSATINPLLSISSMNAYFAELRTGVRF